MRSFVEKTRRVQSSLTHGIDAIGEAFVPCNSATLPHAWPGGGWSRAFEFVGPVEHFGLLISTCGCEAPRTETRPAHHDPAEDDFRPCTQTQEFFMVELARSCAIPLYSQGKVPHPLLATSINEFVLTLNSFKSLATNLQNSVVDALRAVLIANMVPAFFPQGSGLPYNTYQHGRTSYNCTNVKRGE